MKKNDEFNWNNDYEFNNTENYYSDLGYSDGYNDGYNDFNENNSAPKKNLLKNIIVSFIPLAAIGTFYMALEILDNPSLSIMDSIDYVSLEDPKEPVMDFIKEMDSYYKTDDVITKIKTEDKEYDIYGEDLKILLAKKIDSSMFDLNEYEDEFDFMERKEELLRVELYDKELVTLLELINTVGIQAEAEKRGIVAPVEDVLEKMDSIMEDLMVNTGKGLDELESELGITQKGIYRVATAKATLEEFNNFLYENKYELRDIYEIYKDQLKKCDFINVSFEYIPEQEDVYMEYIEKINEIKKLLESNPKWDSMNYEYDIADSIRNNMSEENSLYIDFFIDEKKLSSEQSDYDLSERIVSYGDFEKLMTLNNGEVSDIMLTKSNLGNSLNIFKKISEEYIEFEDMLENESYINHLLALLSKNSNDIRYSSILEKRLAIIESRYQKEK